MVEDLPGVELNRLSSSKPPKSRFWKENDEKYRKINLTFGVFGVGTSYLVRRQLSRCVLRKTKKFHEKNIFDENSLSKKKVDRKKSQLFFDRREIFWSPKNFDQKNLIRNFRRPKIFSINFFFQHFFFIEKRFFH